MSLYEGNNARTKIIDKIIRAYKAKKLRLQAQEIEQENIKESKKSSLLNRMVKGYNKNKETIEKQPNQPELSQTDKRRRKLADLMSRSSSWKGLEDYDYNIDKNQ